jgi:hypothetical protein
MRPLRQARPSGCVARLGGELDRGLDGLP